MTVYNGYSEYSGNDAYSSIPGRYNEGNEDYVSDDDYDISVHCRDYSPGGSSSIMDMSDYNTCDNCRHLRQDNKCGLAEKTLS